MSTTQRKRRMIPSQQARRGRRRHRSPDATEQEPVEVVESGAEVVDLTCESSEPVVVDLTNNDSVEIVDEGLSSNRQTESLEEQPGRTLSDSCILCSDDEDVEPDGSTCLYVTDLVKMSFTRDLPQELLVAPSVWIITLRSFKVGGLLFLQNVVTCSAANASVTLSKMHRRVRPAE
eukprot:gi/632974016/ref/XP_007903439.1/ PREDICTED: E3 ubiquitin-protein ligase RNF4 isoform X3 [Callorhinchus milii]